MGSFAHAYLRTFFCTAVILVMEPAMASDAAVRLGFVLNFSRFTNWPSQVLHEGDAMNVCIGPGEPVLLVESAFLERQVVQGHNLRVRLVSSPSLIGTCQVLYLPQDTPGSLESYLRAAKLAGVLTVSDQPGFIEKDGMIGLVQSGNRYLFDINLGAIRRSGLYISTNLLKLARSVR